MNEKQKKIVVMGGSFNPPTLAHYLLMRHAMDALGAERGVFVPVSDAYLKRKLRDCHPPVVLPPELRLNMLRAMCTDERLEVCEKEMGTVEARTVPTLWELQHENPDAELYFLMGADKLALLVHLTEKRDFLRCFQVALYARDQVGIADALRANAVLAPYLHRIVLLPQPEGTGDISSSKVRAMMLAGKPCQEMLCPGVWELFKEVRPADFPDVINQFRGEYDFLSNRFACRFVWQGLTFGNAEAAFQASKCADVQERKVFCLCSAGKAAQKGRLLVPPAAWEAERGHIMEAILTAKFQQNPELLKRLTDTGHRLLIHGNSKGDTLWGVDLYTWQGENLLGKILMKIREKEKDE